MEVVAIVRVLWRARIAVLIGAVVAVALGVHEGRKAVPPTGIASTRMLLDTQQSQLLGAHPAGAETLPWRAQWLADLMGSESVKERIARSAGIEPKQLRVIEPRLGAPEVPTALPLRALEAAAVVTEPYVLIVEYNDQLPTMTLEARAPDPPAAKRLAEAAAGALEADDVPHGSATLQGYNAERVAPVRVRALAADSPVMMAAVMAIAFLVFWCGCIALTPAIGRFRRAALRAQQA
jgi:hypothetical protein